VGYRSMMSVPQAVLSLAILISVTLAAGAQAIPIHPESLVSNGQILEAVAYKGRQATHFVDRGRSTVSWLKDIDFHNGTLEVDLAASPAKGAPEVGSGFTGLAFRAKDDRTYEAFYIRPNNARAIDQLRRNHSTQYMSEPE